MSKLNQISSILTKAFRKSNQSISAESTLAHINGDVTWGAFLFICYERGQAKARNGRGLWFGWLWPASGNRLAAQLLPGCLADTRQTSLLMRDHVWFVGVFSVHPGQMWMKSIWNFIECRMISFSFKSWSLDQLISLLCSSCCVSCLLSAMLS